MTADNDTRRFLSAQQCQHLADRILDVSTTGETQVVIASWWRGELRWARNRVTLASDRRNTEATITRILNGASGTVRTNQFDNESIAGAVKAAERLAMFRGTDTADLPTPLPTFTYAPAHLWSDTTYGFDESQRGTIAEQACMLVEGQKMSGAGYLEVGASAWAHITSRGLKLYQPSTAAQYSVTARNPKGTGSGWAGISTYDWKKIDHAKLSGIALDKCLKSQNPVAVEPGRYMTILEPQAVADLMVSLFGYGDYSNSAFDRKASEGGKGPFSARVAQQSLLGQPVFDARVTLSHDPSDPELGVRPFTTFGDPYRKVVWVDKGILTSLAYDRSYALERLNEDLPLPNAGAFRMNGGDTSIEEMIRTTRRGILVSRMSNGMGRSLDTGELNGYTRDGVWLIENGAIAKPIKNFRFRESPLFILNRLEQIGPAATVFRPGLPTIVPALKVRDFNFVALSDAI